MVKLKFNIKNTLGKEKKETIEFVERKLNDLDLEYGFFYPESGRIDLVDRIITFYRLEVINNEGWDKRYDWIGGNNWLEKIEQAKNNQDLEVIKENLGRVITAFGAKETPKFREITGKLVQLQVELAKDKVDQNKVKSLKYDIIPRFTRDIGSSDRLDGFYNAPVVYTFFDKKTVEEIEDRAEDRKKRANSLSKSKGNPLSEINHNTVNHTNAVVETEPKKDNYIDSSDIKPKSDNSVASQPAKELETNVIDFTQIENNVEQKASQKEHDNSEKLTSLLTQAKKEKDNYEKLLDISQEIEKLSATASYQEQKTEVGTIKDQLNKLNPVKYQASVVAEINDLKTEGLDEETQQQVAAVQQGKITDPKKLEAVKDKVKESSGKKEANNLVKSLLAKAKEIKEKVTKGKFKSLGSIKKQTQETLTKIYEFSFSSNVFHQKVYAENREKMEKSVAELKALSFDNNQTTAPTQQIPWRMVVPLGLGGIIIVGLAIMLRKRRFKKAKA